MEEGDFIKISFTGKIKNGEVFNTTDREKAKEADIFEENRSYGPKSVVLGRGNLVQGFEEKLLKSEVGSKGEIEIPPEKGFGERKDQAIVSLSKREFESRFDVPPRRGETVEMDNRRGVILSTVGGHVRIDFNHPLAGQTLIYEYEVLEKIEDEEEKVKAIIENSTGTNKENFEAKISDKTVKITPPSLENLNQNWIFMRRSMAQRILSTLEVEKVQFIETFEKDDLEEPGSRKQMLENLKQEQKEIEEEEDEVLEEAEEEREEEIEEG